MAIPVIMPRQGQSVESCIITGWSKQVGDAVYEGDLLFTYETDKSTFEETAKISGTLLAIFFQVDDDVPCLTNVAVIGAPGESYLEFAPNATPADAEVSKPIESAKKEEIAAPKQTVAKIEGISPRAKMLAERIGVLASDASPTGPFGRIIERDVLTLAQAARTGASVVDNVHLSEPVPAASTTKAVVQAASVFYTDEPISNLRKMIGSAMHDSLSGMAQLTHTSSFDATAIINLRKQFKNAPEELGLGGITLNDMVLYAVSRVLTNHKNLNANLLNNTTMRYFTDVHLGMAVDTPRGLLVPTIFDANKKSLKEISDEAKSLAKAAQAGNISPDLLTGGTFTVSNLGSLGVETFTPVINPPQTGILGVCCTIDRPRTVNGVLQTYPAMGLSLTYDHRALDGAPASKFLKELCLALANFNILLAR